MLKGSCGLTNCLDRHQSGNDGEKPGARTIAFQSPMPCTLSVALPDWVVGCPTAIVLQSSQLTELLGMHGRKPEESWAYISNAPLFQGGLDWCIGAVA